MDIPECDTDMELLIRCEKFLFICFTVKNVMPFEYGEKETGFYDKNVDLPNRNLNFLQTVQNKSPY